MKVPCLEKVERIAIACMFHYIKLEDMRAISAKCLLILCNETNKLRRFFPLSPNKEPSFNLSPESKQHKGFFPTLLKNNLHMLVDFVVTL